MTVYLTIGIRTPDGHTPVSYMRGQDVGVGGAHTWCTIAAGEPVRRATQRELRRLDRQIVARYRNLHPDGVITVRRSHHH